MKLKFPLINTHTHAAMVAFCGMAEDLPLIEWLEKYIWPAEAKKVNPRFVYENTKKAIREMRANGIELFADMYFFPDQVARAAKEMKMSVLTGEGLIDFPTPSAKNFDEGLKITEDLLKKYKDDKLVKISVNPHSIYTVSKENLIKAKKLADKYKAPIHIHLSETKKEFDDCQKQHGLTPTEYLDKLGLLGPRTILAHCVWMTDKDLDIIAKRKSSVAHCPLSNLKLGSGIAPVAKMIEKGINVALGTDGAASSNRLDIFEAGKFAALLQKGISNDPTQIPAKTAFEMMSVNGMKALGFPKIGKQNLKDVQKKIANMKDYSFLYS
ncbi:MAG: amidohydrolase [Patescibacteria group bacterium]